MPDRSRKNYGLHPLYSLPKQSEIMSKNNEGIDLSHFGVFWDPVCTSSHFISLSDECIQLYKFEKNMSSIRESDIVYNAKDKLKNLHSGCWDPHYPNRFITVNDRHIRVWDTRILGKKSGDNLDGEINNVLNGHSDEILSIDHNPNKPYHIVTSGKDRSVKFWDLRNCKQALKQLSNHDHWIWNAKFNPFHDQLVITSSSDTKVSLWNIVSVSSAPLGNDIGGTQSGISGISGIKQDNTSLKNADKLIRTFKEHEESVYATTWSNCNAWVFASLSRDGRLSVCHVPSSTKYDILL